MTTPFTGTGYTYVQSGSNYTITFDISGNIEFTSNLFSVSYIVVGGGGGGGGGGNTGPNGGGGGGGGGVTLGSFDGTPNVQYTVTIGKGGNGSIPGLPRGSGGEASTLVSSTINCVSNGGQGGSTSIAGGNLGQGGSSGSGGSGGNVGLNGINGGGGGGGGAGVTSGNGSLSNNSNLYGGGGGGGYGSLSALQLGPGNGVGGGGNGIDNNGTNGFDGVANTGGGGGGGKKTSSRGGNGGSGIVILFYYSAPETKLITYNENTGINVDLNTIFTPYSSGTQAPQTNYTINGVDLNLIFEPSSVGQSINFNTGYTVNGLDLRYIFNTPYYYVDRSLSTNNGVNIRNFGYFAQLDCSYDGKYCIAASVRHEQYGAVFISSNTGQTWTAVYPDGIISPTANPTSWQFCCCSSTGQIMIAGTTTKLYKSTNYGSSWSLIYTYTSHNLRLCASNADCSRIYITTNMGPIICLDGSGTLYYNTPSGYGSNGITTNNTGQYVYYVTNGIIIGNGVYYSSDYGQTFNKSTTNGNGVFNSWAAIKCDNSGKYVYASEVNSRAIVYSNDFGVNYYFMINPNSIPGNPSNDQGCYSITCDGTGNVVTFATFPMDISTSTGGGVYQTKNALTNINNSIIANNTPNSITWSIIGNSTEFTQDSYWMSVTSDNNTGKLLVMNTAYETSLSNNGGLYTYNMCK